MTTPPCWLPPIMRYLSRSRRITCPQQPARYRVGEGGPLGVSRGFGGGVVGSSALLAMVKLTAWAGRSREGGVQQSLEAPRLRREGARS